MAQMNPAEMEGLDQKAMMEQMNMQQLAQIQAMQDQYMKLQQSCEEKCVKTSYKERGLTKVEAVCIDNCVVKYMQFDHNTKNHLREIQEPMQLEQLKYAQMELGRQMGL